MLGSFSCYPQLELPGGGQAHRHPVGHEQDQGRCDVDGEEGIRGSFEILPLAAAEQVLVAWRRHKDEGEFQLLLLPSLQAREKQLAGREPGRMGTMYRLPPSTNFHHLLGTALSVLVEASL